MVRASSRGIRPCSSPLSTEKSAAGVFQTVGGAVPRANHEPRVAAPHRSTCPDTGPRADLRRGNVRENRLLIEATEAAQLLAAAAPKLDRSRAVFARILRNQRSRDVLFGASACAARRNRRKLNASHDPRQRSERARQLWPRCPHEAGKPGRSRDAGPAREAFPGAGR